LVGEGVLVRALAVDGDPEAAEEAAVVGEVLVKQRLVATGDSFGEVATGDDAGVLPLGGRVVIEAVEAGGGGDDKNCLIGIRNGEGVAFSGCQCVRLLR